MEAGQHLPRALTLYLMEGTLKEMSLRHVDLCMVFMDIGILNCEQNIFILYIVLHSRMKLLSCSSPWAVCAGLATNYNSKHQLIFFAIYVSKEFSFFLRLAPTQLPQDLIYQNAEELSPVH